MSLYGSPLPEGEGLGVRAVATQPLNTPRSERAELAEHVESYATFVLANLLWAIASIPVVTLPAATAGLFAVMRRRVEGDTSDTISTFVGGMRRHWRKATLLALLDLLGGGLVALNLLIFPLMDLTADPFAFVARSVTLFVALALLAFNVYAWPLLVTFDAMPFRELVTSSARLAFVHPAWSLGVALVVTVIVGFSLLLPRGVFALATVAACALVVSWAARRVIRQHTPDKADHSS